MGRQDYGACSDKVSAVNMPVQESVAAEVMYHTAQVAEMAAGITERLGNRLGIIMRNDIPVNPTDKAKLSREYPQLFKEWDNHICAIQSCLWAIEGFIQRLEV